MKQYIVMQTWTATGFCSYFPKGEVRKWYSGKGGYTRVSVQYLPKGGWSKRCYAEQFIKRNKKYNDLWKGRNQNAWNMEYEVIEIN